MESILTSIKLLLGVTEEYTHYDPQIIMHINSVFTILNQLGVGPEDGFRIEDKTTTWNDYFPETKKLTYEGVKTYVYAKVKLIFDPPANSSHIQALEKTASEFEWRLNFAAETNQPSE
jgi:hypothetical protein